MLSCRWFPGAVLAFAIVPGLSAQTREATLQITVVDPSGAVIPGATVTVASLEDAAKRTTPPGKTSDKGLLIVGGLVPGRYSIQAEFPGFEPGILRDVRLRGGDNKHVVVLPLRRVEDSVTVSRDAQAVAAERRGGSFSSALTREEINALSDDPAEMAQQLLDMAGGNAVIRIDSFLGGPLPPKAMIKSIHVVRDTFAAENHSAEFDEIEIITQPGVGPLHGGGNSRVRDGSMSARSPFTPTKGPERTQNYEGHVGGTIIPKRASFSISGTSRRSFDTPILYVAQPGGGVRSEVSNLRRPSDLWETYDLFDYAITKDQMLRMSYEQSNNTRKNQGVGASDLPERAYSTGSRDHEFRIQESGPLGRRSFMNTRLQLTWTDTDSRSALEAPTIRISDIRTTGGAQVSGGRRSRDFEFASDVDYVRGKHSVRAGVLLEGGHFRSDDSSNYLGTYTFITMESFLGQQPATYTRRVGNPLIDYWNLRSGAYVQDDIRVRKGLTVSPGLRYETQTHVRDLGNLGPRFGLTWSPRKSGRTTVRASAGIFYNWVPTGTYEQTLRVDGFRQREINIVHPTFPSVDTGGTVLPTNRYVLGSEVEMSRTVRVSTGVDQRLTPAVRFSATYSHVRGTRVLRGLNLNAPVGGVRPDPVFANVIETVSDATLDSHQLQTNLNVNLAPPGRAAGQGRFNPRRANLRFSYTAARVRNNTDGAFSVPPSGIPATEWGPAPNDRRQRLSAALNSQALKHLNASVMLAGNSGTPYTLTTGLDDNGDLIYNDRPAGIGRNTLRTPSQLTVSANFSYSIDVGAAPVGGDASERSPRRLTFSAQIANVTNRANYGGFSGVMTSEFFRRATSVQNPRKIDLVMSFNF
jgi:carboxypeptidase family protein